MDRAWCCLPYSPWENFYWQRSPNNALKRTDVRYFAHARIGDPGSRGCQICIRIRLGNGQALTSHICVKNATNSPNVRKWGLSKGRRYGITINFWSTVSDNSRVSSSGTQWLRESRLRSGEENCRAISSSCPLLAGTLLSMTCFPSWLHVASIAEGN